MTGLEQTLDHRRAHAAGPDPANLGFIRHYETPIATLRRL
jgi:hypothetical protein